MSIKTYIINLDKDKNRLKIVTNDLSKTQLSYERFPAILGRDITDNDKKKYFKRSTLPFLTDSMRGCALSHYKVYEKFLAGNEPYILILEDDAIVNPEFDSSKIHMDILNLIENTHDKWNIIRLYCQGPCGYNNTLKIQSMTGSTLAYIINREGAYKILQNPISYHIDMQTVRNRNISINNTPKPLFIHNGISISNGRSDVTKDKGFFNKYDRPLMEHLSADIIKIPITNVKINGFRIIYFIVFIIVIYLLVSRYKQRKRRSDTIDNVRNITYM